MSIVNLTRRPREIGRIRMGDKGQRGNPQRLEKFRLTSADRTLLLEAAKLYGGEVQPWKDQPGQFELYIQSDELPCMIAPQEVSQWYELWSGGGCQRRCDGVMEAISGGECICDPDARECKLTTRLSVMLHELPGMGTWRLETHGFYAATEIPSSAELLINLAQRGTYAPAALAIEQREVKREGKTKRFPVPVIRIRQSLQQLMTGEVVNSLPAPAPAALPASVSAPSAPAAAKPAIAPELDTIRREYAGLYCQVFGGELNTDDEKKAFKQFTAEALAVPDFAWKTLEIPHYAHSIERLKVMLAEQKAAAGEADPFDNA